MTRSGEADYVEAKGIGEELFEAPALFYLTHAESIRRWAELGHVARSATNDYLQNVLEDLGSHIETSASASSWDVIVADTRGYRHLLLAPPGTPLAEDKTPAIACCFGWNQNRVRITPHTFAPFTGVRVGLSATLSEWRSTFLNGNGRSARHLISLAGCHKTTEWPVWKHVTGSDRWWADLDRYRAKVIAAFDSCFGTFGSEVERTNRQMSAYAPAAERLTE